MNYEYVILTEEHGQMIMQITFWSQAPYLSIILGAQARCIVFVHSASVAPVCEWPCRKGRPGGAD